MAKVNGAGGFKETEVGDVPAEWEAVHLEDIATDFFSGGTPSTKRPEYWQGEIPWTTSAYISEDLYLRRGAKTISQLGLENSSSNLVPKNNLLIGSRVGVGKVAINTLDIAISQDLTAMILNLEKAVPGFVAYAIRADTTQRLFQSAMRGTTIKGIARDDLKQIPIPLPPLPEQHGIAHTLSTIQRAIAAQDAVIASAREVKRSLMHRLFTYGPYADPLPTKETEIGEVPEAWNVAQLGELCEFLQYGTSERCNTDPSGIPVLRIPNVVNGRVDTSDLKFIKLPSATVKHLQLEVGDLLFVRTNGRREYTGRCAVFKGELPQALFASYLIRARVERESLLSEFVQAYAETLQGKSFLSGRASNAADGKFNINTQTIKSVLVPVPSLDEQAKIASALHTCDTKIATEENRKAALQVLFKSMLHELMTGKVRVGMQRMPSAQRING